MRTPFNKTPKLLACPRCNGRGRRLTSTWTLGKGWQTKGPVCGDCKGAGTLPG